MGLYALILEINLLICVESTIFANNSPVIERLQPNLLKVKCQQSVISDILDYPVSSVSSTKLFVTNSSVAFCNVGEIGFGYKCVTKFPE